MVLENLVSMSKWRWNNSAGASVGYSGTGVGYRVYKIMEILNRNDNSLGVFFTPGTHNPQKDSSGIDINYG